MTTPTTEAIEAAARALWNDHVSCCSDPKWDDVVHIAGHADDVAQLRAQATAALAAAAPFIAAHAKAEALREAADALDGIYVKDWLRERAATIEGKSE